MRERVRTALICGVVLAVGLAATAGASRLITGSQIKNGSIGLVDLSKSARRALAGKAGPAGPAGPQGAQGPAGATGPAALNAIHTVVSPRVTIPPGESSYDVQQAGGPSLEADCPPGQVVVGTGFNDSVGYVAFVESFGTLVGGFMYNDSSSPISIDVTVQAMCAPGSASGTAATSLGHTDSSFERAAADAQARFKHS